MSTELSTIDFHGDALEAVRVGDDGFVTLRSLLEPFGKEPEKQIERLSKWARIKKVRLPSRSGVNGFTDLGTSPNWVIDHRDAPLAIAELDSRGMSAAIAEKHVLYKRGCADVLHRHFTTGGSIDLRALAPLLAEMVATAVRAALADHAANSSVIGATGAKPLLAEIRSIALLHAVKGSKLYRSTLRRIQNELRQTTQAGIYSSFANLPERLRGDLVSALGIIRKREEAATAHRHQLSLVQGGG